MWSEVFTDPNPAFNRRPNAFPMKSIEGKTPGKALDIVMGPGPELNHTRPAGMGCNRSRHFKRGRYPTLTEAKKQNVTIHGIVASADEVDYQVNVYDLITPFMSTGLPPSMRTSICPP